MVQNHLKVSYQCHTMFLVPRPYRFRDMDAQICSNAPDDPTVDSRNIGQLAKARQLKII